MRVLALETSSPRGSVALVEHGKLVLSASHEEPNLHAERILPMIQRLLAEAGVDRGSLDRIAVGVGPGSFTGLRVGIALAIGLGLGLDRPVVGVSSLAAMVRGVPSSLPQPRCPLLDARRDELFTATYDEQGRELSAPHTVARAGVLDLLATAGELVIVGRVIDELKAGGPGLVPYRSADTDLPSAHWVGVIGGALDAALHPPEPIYVRGAGATLPKLPPSPLSD
jgi:tRNA threonylcarbamoyladenosine biosynthesis protein TsaB